MSKSNRYLVIGLVAIVLIVAIIGGLKFMREDSSRSLYLNGSQASLFSHPRTIQPFSLREGETGAFNDKSLKGRWSILFFGYTHCPDICPTTLSLLNNVWEKLPAHVQSKLQIVFISVDPERDTPEAIEKYATYFNRHFRAATGTPSQLKQLAQQLGVAYFKVETEQDSSYLINHTGSLMLFNPLGQYTGLFSPPLKSDYIVNELEQIVH